MNQLETLSTLESFKVVGTDLVAGLIVYAGSPYIGVGNEVGRIVLGVAAAAITQAFYARWAWSRTCKLKLEN